MSNLTEWQYSYYEGTACYMFEPHPRADERLKDFIAEFADPNCIECMMRRVYETALTWGMEEDDGSETENVFIALSEHEFLHVVNTNPPNAVVMHFKRLSAHSVS